MLQYMVSGKIEDCFVKNTDSGPSDRRTPKSGEYPEDEDALYSWFLQECNRHTSISGEIIREKAKYFYKMIMKKDDFRASNGGLDIRFLAIMKEKLSCDVSVVHPFVRKFQEKIEELGLEPEQVYNADKSSLFWRLLPTKLKKVQPSTKCPKTELDSCLVQMQVASTNLKCW